MKIKLLNKKKLPIAYLTNIVVGEKEFKALLSPYGYETLTLTWTIGGKRIIEMTDGTTMTVDKETLKGFTAFPVFKLEDLKELKDISIILGVPEI